MLTYPHIDPIAISIGPLFGIGPLRVHWYGIMYLIGFTAAWWLARYRARRPGSTWTPLDVDDLIFYCAVGVIAGGRAGWCLFYGHDVIAENWLNAFHIWEITVSSRIACSPSRAVPRLSVTCSLGRSTT